MPKKTKEVEVKSEASDVDELLIASEPEVDSEAAKRDAEIKRLQAENEKLQAELAKKSTRKAVAPVDPDNYLFVHTDYKGCKLHLPSGKTITFKNHFGKVSRKDVASYEAVKATEDFRAKKIVEWTPDIQVEDYSPRVSEGVITTVDNKV